MSVTEQHPFAVENGHGAAADGDPAARPGTDARGGDRTALHVAMVHMSDFRIDSRIQRLAGALAERGDEVHLFCLGEADEIRVGSGLISVHPIRCPKPSGGARAYLLGYTRFLVAAAGRLTAHHRRRRFDVIEAHNMPDILTAAALAPRLRGTPVILNVHDTFPELFATKFNRPLDHPIMRVLELEERIGAALADRLVTVTDEARHRLAARGVGVGRTAVVMNSPDERVFGPPRPPRALPTDGQAPLRVLYHGGLAPRYGVETLIRAFARLRDRRPPIELRVCGTGEDRDRLVALARDVAPGCIDITRDPVPFERIPAELAAAHIGVVPTLHDPFTELLLPVKLLEYVHMGLPVVASRLPGIEGYFSDRELLAFEPGDAEGLASAIEAVCADPAAADARATRAAERLSTIAWDQQRARYLDLVDDLTVDRQRARSRSRAQAPKGV